MDSLERRADKPIRDVSTSSIKIRPLLSSTRRYNATKSELFPAPVRPTIPIFSPGATRNVSPRKTRGRLGLYLICTFSNTRAPLWGHAFGGSWSVRAARSDGRSTYSWILSTEFRLFSATEDKRTRRFRIPVTASVLVRSRPATPGCT